VRVALLFDGISALAQTPDLLILENVEAVEGALEADGHDSVRVPVGGDGRWVERLRRGRFDLAFNLCEGIDGVSALEPAVIGALELLGIPYTGSSSWTTALCLRKPAVNSYLASLGLPIPPWGLARVGQPLPHVGFPALVKPAAEDASLGVEQRSVVRTKHALAERVGAMHELWNEVLVQRYIDGREINVGVVGNTVLPISEIDFSAMPKGFWRIVSYKSKWYPETDEDVGSVPRCPAEIPEDTAQQIRQIALAAWRAVGGEGYGRVDMRIDRLGRPWILEVNANPDFSTTEGIARMAKAAGIDYHALVRLVCQHALERPRVSDDERWNRILALSGMAPAAAASAAEPERSERTF
jgi:D-alanine-D-alanine ligase